MKKRLIALALVIPILSGCSNVQDELNQETFFNKLFPNPWEALATLIAFIVLLLVVFYGNIFKVLCQRLTNTRRFALV